MDSMKLDPALGDFVLTQVELQAGCPCHIVLVVCPIKNDDNEKFSLGEPTFITSLDPDDAEKLLVQVGKYMEMGPERTDCRRYNAPMN